VPERRSDAYYRELEARLRALVPFVSVVVTEESARWFAEYLDAGEYGLAVEVVAEQLPTHAQRQGVRDLSKSLLAEAELMGLSDALLARLRMAADGAA
jgi:hypothetical protein